MSAITIAGDVSGTVTLDAPAVAGTTVLTLPATSGSLMVNGPAFSASKSATQSVSNSTFTRIVFDSETFDTNNNYDIGNGRFTPTVAGYYQFNAAVGFAGQTSQSLAINFYKNNSNVAYAVLASSNANGLQAFGSALIYCNGSTDYIEVYAWQNSGASLNVSTNAYFQGFLARSA